MLSKILPFAFVAFSSVSCSILGGGGGDYLVRGEVGSFSIKPDGEFGLATTVGVSVTGIDLKDLGLDDKQNEVYGKANLRLGSSELSLSAFQTDFSGSGTLTAAFGTIPISTTVNSSLELTNAKFLWRWYLIDMDILSFGPGIGADYMDMKAEITAPSLSTTEDFDAKAPIPLVGASAELRLGPVAAYADAYGFSASQGDADGTFLDLEGGLRLKPLPYVDATVGYRVIDIQAKGEDANQSFDADYKLPGLFFSVAIRF